ncbi:calcium-binding protein [Roseinatronobacter thiooxidans]|uniref:calcium-binding protein n=1 Tax=Roseinatronobacter thiooxidans TaxID=121821 RepID=UPI0008F842AF|nr:calcium-binding protein [Roseinatronobacter thiooxidans]
MWMFFGLLAAIAAASVSDAMVASREDDVESDGRADAVEGGAFAMAPAPALSGLMDADDGGARIDLVPDDVLATGLFDDLDERIHSSDLFAPVVLKDDVESSGPADAVEGGASEMSPPAAVALSGLMDATDGGARIDLVPDDALATGLFDDLDERIHSSDLFAPVAPPQPVFLEGGAGNDRLVGTVANDTLVGGAGDDILIGAGGDDVLYVDSGANHLIGGEGDDSLIGGAGNDTLEGGWGNDLLVAGGGANLLMGGAGDDTLLGAFLDDAGQDRSGANFLNGGAGDDLLIAGQGDTLNGGAGADFFALGDWLAGRAPAMIVDYSPEQDQIVLHYDPDRLSQPDVRVTFNEDQPDMAEIRLNGQIVAHVANASGLTADAIAIVAGHPAAIAAE